MAQYEILDVVGCGGQGAVYRARDHRLDRVVAIKALHVSENSIARYRFEREIQIAARLVHPNVATVFDVIEWQESSLLVMEFVEGGTLFDSLEPGKISRAVLVRIAIQAATALNVIHTAGLVHRDFKPCNLMLMPGEHLKLMDFGIARELPVGGGSEAATLAMEGKLTRPGSLIGTVNYMAPEQVRGEPVDERSDLFALGVVLFEAITGAHPFLAEDRGETMRAIQQKEPGSTADRRQVRRCGQLGRLVMRLLEKSRRNRPADAKEVLSELALAGKELRKVSRRVIAAAAFGALLIGALGATWVGLSGSVEESVQEALRRPSVAVLPLEFLSEKGDADLRARMVADLLSASLSESAALRGVSSGEVRELLSSLPGVTSAALRRARVWELLEPGWIVGGSIYEEAGEYHAVFELRNGGSSGQASVFRVRARQCTRLASLAAAELMQAIGAPDLAGFSPSPAPPQHLPSDEAQLLISRAREAREEGRLSAALGAVERALAVEPEILEALILQSRLLREAGFDERAQEVISVAETVAAEATADPRSRQALLLRATSARARSAYGDELGVLGELATAYPDESHAQLRFGDALRNAGRQEEALVAIARSLELRRVHPRGHLSRGMVLVRLGRIEEAQQEYAEAERLFERLGARTGLADLGAARAWALYAQGEYSAALEAYEHAEELYLQAGLPARAAIMTKSRADMHVVSWQPAEARILYVEALDVLRSSGHHAHAVTTLGGLGAVALRQGDVAGAESFLREAIGEARKLGNRRVEVAPQITLSTLLSSTGRPMAGEEAGRRGLEIARTREDPANEAVAEMAIALALERQGRLAPAREELELVLASDALSRVGAFYRASCLGQLAELEEDAERPGAALAAIEEARQIDGESRAASAGHRRLARSRLRSDSYLLEDAREDLAVARAILGDDPPGAEAGTLLAWSELLLGGAGSGAAEPLAEIPESLYSRPFRLAQAREKLRLEQWEPAEAMARGVRQHPWSTPTERVRASTIEAGALIGRRNMSRAAAMARQALADAQGLGLRLSAARAAGSLLMALEEGESERSALQRTGKEELDGYLSEMPAEHRHRVEASAELSRLAELFR